MRHNDYQEILLMMQNQGSKCNPPEIQFGIVESVSPIQIIKGELPLFEDNLHIRKTLLGYTENTTITDSSGTRTATIVHDSIIEEKDTAILYEIEKNKKYLLLGVV